MKKFTFLFFTLLCLFQFNQSVQAQTWKEVVTGANIPDGAVVGGFEADGRPLYVARLGWFGMFYGAQVRKDMDVAITNYNGMFNKRKKFEVLMGEGEYHWVKVTDEKIPEDAVQIDKARGAMQTSAKYVCRCKVNQSLQVGFAMEEADACLYAMGRGVFSESAFEVLVVGPPANNPPSTEELIASKQEKWNELIEEEMAENRFEVLVREGELEVINLVSYSGDGKYVASNSGGDIVFSDVGTGKIIRHIETDMAEIRDMALSPEGKYLATLSNYSVAAGGTGAKLFNMLTNDEADYIRLWNLETGNYTWLRGVKGVNMNMIDRVKFSPDGKWLASAAKEMVIWDTKLGAPVVQIGKKEGVQSNKVTALAFSPDSKLLASGGKDNKIKIWDRAKGVLLQTLDEHTGTVTAIRFSEDGAHLLSGARDNTVRLWNLEKGRALTFGGHGKTVVDVAFLADGSFASIGKDNTVKVWANNGQVLREFEVKGQGKGDDDMAASFNQNGQYVAYSSFKSKEISLSGGRFQTRDNSIRIVDVIEGREIRKIPERKGIPIATTMLSQDGKWMCSYGEDRMVRLFDLEKVSLHHVFPVADTSVHQVAMAPDLRYIAYYFTDRIELCRLLENERAGTFSTFENREIIQTFESKDIDPPSFTFSSDGLMMAGIKNDKKLMVWELLAENEVRLVGEKNFKDVIRVTNISLKKSSAMAFSSDNKMIAVGTQGHVNIYDVQTMERIKRLGVGARRIISVNFFDNNEKVRALYYLGKGKSGTDNEIGNHSWVAYIGVMDRYYETTRFSDGGSNNAEGEGGFRNMLNDPNEKFVEQDLIVASNDGSQHATVQNIQRSIVTLNDNIFLDNKAEVTTLTFSPNGKVLLTGGKDGTIKLWDVATGEKKLVIVAEDEEFIMLTNDNYYRSSVGGFNLVYLRVKKDIYPFEVMDLMYNRPDTVLTQLSDPDGGLFTRDEVVATRIRSFKKAYKKRLQKVKASGEAFLFDGELEIPQVDILNQLPISTEAASVTVKLRASDPNAKLASIQVYLNDVPVFGKEGLDVRSERTNTIEKEIEVPLTYGDNFIQLSAKNTSGLESFKESYSNIQRKGNSPTRTLHLINMGVSKYADSEMNLLYAAKDAQDLEAIFKQSPYFQGQVKIHPLIDEAVTKENILKLKSELMQSKPDDAVIVFFAGHGLFDQDLEYYLATHDVDFVNPAARGLQVRDLEDLVDGIPAQHKLLMLDACHSGEIDKYDLEFVEAELKDDEEVSFRSVGDNNVASKTGGLENSIQMVSEMFADVRRSSGATVISAAAGVELAGERADLKNGIFTSALKEGLTTKSADLNKDGEIWVKELKQYLTERVQELSKNAQRPTARIENLRNDWRLQ